MKREWIEGYQDICEELESLYLALQAAEAAGPFQALHTATKYGGRVRELTAMKTGAERFVLALPWGKRKLARMVMKHGPHWDVVRREMHSMKSPNALRMEFSRLFENNL